MTANQWLALAILAAFWAFCVLYCLWETHRALDVPDPGDERGDR